MKTLGGSGSIAIVGMACRFPGARDTRTFWNNLRDGIESITFFSDGELLDAGVSAELLANPSYVKAAPLLEGFDEFDAGFFGYSPREALYMDPQHRLLLQTAWEAFEDAGYHPEAHTGVVGSFAGAGGVVTSYLLACQNLDPALVGSTGSMQHIGNDKDFLSTRLSYKLNLTGPSITVQTACSTSLVALHLACRSLRDGECDTALVGTAAVRCPQKRGYLSTSGDIVSPDGHCRAFDRDAQGTVFGSGVAAVILKRLEDAIADRDNIYAVIRGTAVNNDGAKKTSYTVSSALGQAKAMIEAIELSGIKPDTLSYVECHGTGTAMGDPIEVEALTKAFRLGTARSQFCAIGSVKTNVGHLEQSAGLAALIKVALALKHRQIPASLNYRVPNPKIDFKRSPFFVNTEHRPWACEGERRRAAVNGLGLGGTNAFVLLEEAPEIPPPPAIEDRRAHVLNISARSEASLTALASKIGSHLDAEPTASLADVCYTANVSRSSFPFRLSVVARSKNELKVRLTAVASGQDAAGVSRGSAKRQPVVFLFSGQGAQYPRMGLELYRTHAEFRDLLDRCDKLSRPHLDRSLLEVMFSEGEAGELIHQTAYTQPALFAIEYCLAQLWRSWGVEPDAVMGHSVGEIAAACVAGALSFEDAMELVCRRGALMQGLKAGSGGMASLAAERSVVDKLIADLSAELSIAAINSSESVVISGDRDALRKASARAASQGIQVRELAVSHAFHSPHMDPILDALEASGSALRFRRPRRTFISNLMGAQLGEPLTTRYFRDAARGVVLFAEGMRALRGLGFRCFVEVGPGSTLLGLGRQCMADADSLWLPSMTRRRGEWEEMLESAATLYTDGHTIHWKALDRPHQRRRVPLPTYPWQRRRFWIESAAVHEVEEQSSNEEPDELDERLYVAAWRRVNVVAAAGAPEARGVWLIFADEKGTADAVIAEIQSRGGTCVKITAGDAYARVEPLAYRINPSRPDDYRTLLREALGGEGACRGAVHLFSLDARPLLETTQATLEVDQQRGCLSALYLVQALLRKGSRDAPRLWIVTRGVQQVTSDDVLGAPSQAPIWGLGRTVAVEHPELACTLVDLNPERLAGEVEALSRELGAGDGEGQVALREDGRYVARLSRSRVKAAPAAHFSLKTGGSYLITGGLGRLGLSVAQWMVARGARSLVLVGRGAPTDRAERAVEALREASAQVLVIKADVSQKDDVARVIAEIEGRLPPLRGVVHAAGIDVNEAEGILELSGEELTRALAPKVLGALHLHTLTQHARLDFFVLYSSAASLVGLPGQCHIAITNAFASVIARARTRAGLPGMAIQWGSFAVAGPMGAPSERLPRPFEPDSSSLAVEEGLDALTRMLERPRPEVCVLRLQVRQWVEMFPALAESRFLAELWQKKRERDAASGSPEAAARLRQAIESAAPFERRGLLEAHVREQIGKLLHVLPAQIDRLAPFTSFGVDSLLSIEVRNRLEAVFGLKLATTLLFTYPHTAALAEHLLSALNLKTDTEPPGAEGAVAASPAARGAAPEGIAILGMALRFPGGARTPEEFFRLLEEGIDAVTEAPAERFEIDASDADPALKAARWGAFLEEDVSLFDAAFFGITPREAVSMDPQQRLLLEVAWEALERAGQRPASLAGTRTGVFMGATTNDYAELGVLGGPEARNVYDITGNLHCFIPGRIAYLFGLEGPAISVDTACSSSLVAVHLACQSLLSGESELALAGGVNLLLSPTISLLLARGQALSADGRCKSFDARANGYVRGEGCGVVVLKRLSEAQRDGDPILAVIRGSAMNQDGHSAGMTAPNVLSQQAVERQALSNARLSAADIGLVETHGTGTPLGDPIEIDALKAVLGAPREDGSVCVLGALKSNIGHLEAAAGVAGLIKAVLCMQREVIPPNGHFKTLNPRISLEGTPLVIPTATVPWPAGERRRFAGVSSFGMSGTNAHLILEEAPHGEPQKPPVRETSSYLLPLSARSAEALRELARAYASGLETTLASSHLHDIAYTASVRRSHHDHRLAVVGETRRELAQALGAFAAGERQAEVAEGRASPSGQPKVVFVFPGQGSQWLGMGRQLLGEEPAFRDALEACDEAIQRESGFSVIGELWADEATSRIDQIDVVQPLLFAMEVALAALWRSWGIKPDAVLGHSMGEVAAAHVAGALSLEDAARVICRRSRLLRTVSGKGAMAVIELSLDKAKEVLAGYEAQLAVGVNNSPRSTVLSGDPEALEEVLSRLEREKIFCRRVKVDVASHSPQMTPILADLSKALAEIAPRAAELPMRSTVTGELVHGGELAPAYWVDNLRRPVLFGAAAQTLIEEGHTIFVELSPHPSLLIAVEENLEALQRQGLVVASLRRQADERRSLLGSLGSLYAHGCAVDFRRLYLAGQTVAALPTYPWQRQRYWLMAASRAQPGAEGTGHPLLGSKLSLAGEGAVFEVALGIEAILYLRDHRLFDDVVMSGTALLEMARAAAAAHRGPGVYRVAGLVIKMPLFLPDHGAERVQVVLAEAGPEGIPVALYSRSPSASAREGWTEHASGHVQPVEGPTPKALDLGALRARCPTELAAEEVYGAIDEAGVTYGPAYQGMTGLWRGTLEALSRVTLAAVAGSSEGYGMHPAMLDAMMQTLGAALPVKGEIYLPFEFGAFVLWQPQATSAWVHAAIQGTPSPGAEVISADVTLMDDAGAVLVAISDLRLKRADVAALRRAKASAAPAALFELTWQAAPPAPGSSVLSGSWLVLTCGSTLSGAVAARIEATGARCTVARLVGRLTDLDAGGSTICPDSRGAFEPLLSASSTEPLSGIVCLWGGDALSGASGSLAEEAEKLSVAALHLVQALVKRAARPRVYWVTEGAQAVLPGESVAAGQASLWGLGRVVMREHPELSCVLLDLEPLAEGAAEDLERQLSSMDDEVEVAFRGRKRYAERLVKARVAPSSALPLPAAADSTVLITGGLGGLGLSVARWLIEEHKVRHLVLAARRAPLGERLAKIEELRAMGAEVRVATLDVADPAAVRALVASLPVEPPLRGIIHAAGVSDDGALSQESASRFAALFAPKARGAWNLHEATREMPLDFFVLFSSAAVIWGSAEQGGDAAASAFLDGLSHRRKAEGLAALSIDWGPWSEAGTSGERRGADRARVARLDIGALSPSQGVALLGQALSQREPELGAWPLDLGAMLRALGGEVPPLFRVLLQARTTEAQAGALKTWASRLDALDAAAKRAEVLSAVRADLAKVLLLPPSTTIPDDEPFRQLGLDSLMAVELRNAISARVGKPLSATLVFDYPTVGAVADFLLARVLDGARPKPAPAPAPRLVPARGDESIAILGIGCRFPGGIENIEDFWELLEQGIDAIREVPKDRWDIDAYYDPDPNAIGKMSSRWGGFLDNPDLFEPAFFGMSPREAASVDPQERLLLETTWEALERAGIVPAELMNSDTGVYMAIAGTDYQRMAFANIEACDVYTLLGVAHSTVSGRLSYWLGLKGPNIPVDTACSGSLVAVHLACQALRAGECTMAIAGGVNSVLTPEPTVYFSKTEALSPTGRCHAFAAEANGFVRSEGCGVIVLKRLCDAERDGDPILAIIRGSAVNQDGRSNGPAAPNGPSQEAVIRRALSHAGLLASDVDYVEAHGTGTQLGDPIEAQALGAALGEGRAPDRPLLLGSVKTNFGHTESAAGVAGLIKAVLAITHGVIPPSLHFTSPNPYIPWSELPLRVVAEATPWPAHGKPRIAGVSSFGVSGTNAHVIVAEAPARGAAPLPESKAASYLLPLSAKTRGSLVALARAYHAALSSEGDESTLHDLAYTASVRRTHHAHRFAVVGRTRRELAEALDAFAEGQEQPEAAGGRASLASRPKLVFVFPGHGSQWLGMGRQLLEEEPAFREAMAACDEAIKRESGFSVIDELQADEASSRLGQVDVIQPALFAIEVALAALWCSWGLEPDAVLGHSMGEIAAAHVAGALALDDAARIISSRSRLLTRLRGRGTMVLVERSLEEAERALDGYEDRVSVAVSNSPRSTVLSGEQSALAEIVARLELAGVSCRWIKADGAGHSPQIDPLLEEFGAALAALSTGPARVPMRSSVTGKLVTGGELVAAYWKDNLRKPVLFSAAAQALIGEGYTTFLELSPHPILLPSIEENLRELGQQGTVVASLRRQTSERLSLQNALAVLYRRGHAVHWRRLYAREGSVVPLPNYPFQRERYWLPEGEPKARGSSRATEALSSLTALLEGAALIAQLGLEGTYRPEAQSAVSQALDALRGFSEKVRPGESKRAAALARGDRNGGGRAPFLNAEDGPADVSRAMQPSLREMIVAAPKAERKRMLEQRIRGVVAEALGYSHPGQLDVEASFTDLGLDSLMSLKVKKTLEAELGLTISVNWAFVTPSIAALSARMFEDVTRTWALEGGVVKSSPRPGSLLVPLQPAGKGPPLFLIHPMGGPVLCFIDLVRHLGKDRPVYGIQAKGFDDGEEPDEHVEAMAERYIQEIRAVQSTGPYLLGGLSLGGTVAFEMAQQLVRSGERVALLALIEGFMAPSIEPEYQRWVTEETVRIFNPGVSQDELTRLSIEALHGQIVDELTKTGIAGFSEALRRLYPAHQKAGWSYRPRTYAGPITYLRGSIQPRTYPFGEVPEPYGMMYQPLRELSSYPVEVHEVPGSHVTIAMDPNVAIVASRLRQCIRETEEPAGRMEHRRMEEGAEARSEPLAVAARGRAIR